jgi:type IV pilus assembly protein PilB
MATNAAVRTISGLARAMVQHGLLSEYDAETMQSQAQVASVGFVEQMVLSKRMSAAQIAMFASRAFGTPMMDLAAFDTEHIDKELVDARICVTRRVLPLYKRGNRLFVAVSDPANLQALDEVRFKTNLVVDAVVVEDDKLGQAIAKVIETANQKLSSMVTDDDLNIDVEESTKSLEDEYNPDVDDAPLVRYLQKILVDAISAGVSDIHLEPYEKFYRIRYRLDGQLMEVAQPPLAIKDKMASRIKVISKLDISEKRVPQDGRMKLVLSKNRAIDFRVSTPRASSSGSRRWVTSRPSGSFLRKRSSGRTG